MQTVCSYNRLFVTFHLNGVCTWVYPCCSGWIMTFPSFGCRLTWYRSTQPSARCHRSENACADTFTRRNPRTGLGTHKSTAKRGKQDEREGESVCTLLEAWINSAVDQCHTWNCIYLCLQSERQHLLPSLLSLARRSRCSSSHPADL